MLHAEPSSTGAAGGPAINDESALETWLSLPDEALVESLGRLPGDIILLGAGGKMGFSLARLAQRALEAAPSTHRVIAVSRFSDPARREAFARHGIDTAAADLLDQTAVETLPDAGLVVVLAGLKFGTRSQTARTWASNALIPYHVMQRYAGRPIVAFSSGNVYGLVPVDGPGARVGDRLHPVGEYAMSVLARERMYEYLAERTGTPTALIRLNYACELRYGVLVDIARWVRDERPVPLTMGYFNVIWQGDANRMTLRAWEHARPSTAAFNVTGPRRVGVREVATWFARRWDRRIVWEGTEAPDALLADASSTFDLLGRPSVGLEQMLDSIAQWIESGNPLWNKPTHFENRAGDF